MPGDRVPAQSAGTCASASLGNDFATTMDAQKARSYDLERAGGLVRALRNLAAVAERTRALRLGVAVVVLPFEQPIRLAEDAAVVDLLSGGRLELGVGSGFDPKEFLAFGRDAAQRRELTSAGLRALQHTLRGGGLAADRVLPFASDLILQFSPATPTLTEALRMIEQVATQIAPALGWQPRHSL